MKFKADLKVVQWDAIEKIANNDLSRVIGLIPIVGYVILFNDQIAGFVSFQVIAGSSDDPKTPFFLDGLNKMRLIFFGSLLILASNLIFRLARPAIL